MYTYCTEITAMPHVLSISYLKIITKLNNLILVFGTKAFLEDTINVPVFDVNKRHFLVD